MVRKEIYLSFLLSILLFINIDISFYNHIVLGKENDDSGYDDKIEKYDDEDDEVPFKLPFNAVPFP